MELLVLDTNLTALSILDTSESIIWTDRYSKCGDFEIYEKASEYLLSLLQPEYYLYSRESEHMMIIEDREIKEDVEDGDVIIVKGRSLESMLERRIIWQQTVLTGSLQNGIEKLLNENVISPTIPERAIPNFVFEASTDVAITELTIDAQYMYENLYDSILGICDAYDIGFKVTLSDDNKFVFKLYAGVDRSYNQLLNPYVIFSPTFDNLINGNYSETQKKYKNVSLVAGEGEGSARTTAVVGEYSGLDRRELYTDAKSVSKTVDNITLTDEEYQSQLIQKGTEDLANHVFDIGFEGQADTNIMFKYGEDYFLGDIVQFVSGYGVEAMARITEIIRSHNTSGIDTYPTFKILG